MVPAVRVVEMIARNVTSKSAKNLDKIAVVNKSLHLIKMDTRQTMPIQYRVDQKINRIYDQLPLTPNSYFSSVTH